MEFVQAAYLRGAECNERDTRRVWVSVECWGLRLPDRWRSAPSCHQIDENYIVQDLCADACVRALIYFVDPHS